MIKFSLSVANTPWIPARVDNLRQMLMTLTPLARSIPYLCHDTDYRGKPWEAVKKEWALTAWKWHLKQDVSHCVLMSDDLSIMPDFWDVLGNMVHSASNVPIGLMSNHPDGPALFDAGHHWYKCNSWLVGPAICIPRNLLAQFVIWYESWLDTLPTGKDEEGYREFYHDDSSLNEWVSKKLGAFSLHPLPAPIEHNLHLGRSHDAKPFPKHAAEWISWKRVWHSNPERDRFSELPRHVAEQMNSPGWWFGANEAPMLKVV